MTTTYSVRVIDARSGRQLGRADDLDSAHAAGRVAADAYTVLIARDGYDPAHLELEGVAVADGEVRGYTEVEQAAMVAALDQHMAEIKKSNG
jgi:hypothetical protein